eukprot:g3498.t1
MPETASTINVERLSSSELRTSILRFVQSRVRDCHLAEDLTQEILLRGFSRISDLKNNERLESWLFQIARNVIADYFRRAKSNYAYHENLPDVDDDLCGYIPEEEAVLREMLSSFIRGVVESLPANYRNALRYTDYEGHTQAQLAEKEGLSLSGAKSRVQRARQEIRAAVARCCHIETDRMFSPWRHNIDPASRRLLEKNGWTAPDGDKLPNGGEIVRDYLEPLSRVCSIASALHLGQRVTAITRSGIDKVRTPSRACRPFLIRTTDSSGLTRTHLAKAVIDASGTWRTPNPMGADGLPVSGEAEYSGFIDYGMPDVKDTRQHDFAGAHVLVVGSGHSSFNAILDLLDLKEKYPATRITWAMRKTKPGNIFGGGAADALPARGQLGQRVREAVESGAVEIITPVSIERLAAQPDGRGLTVHARVGCTPLEVAVDRIVVGTGFRPDLGFSREIRLRLDPALECAEKLGPMIDPNEHSCGSVPPHGAAELAHPEPGYYIVGMKSYGRAPTFLLATGYEQVRSVVAEIAGDHESAANVELLLRMKPDTPHAPDPSPAPPWAIAWRLAWGQLLVWGVLYYAFTALSAPIHSDTGWSSSLINGGLSLGLLVWGILALPVGMWIQRRGARSMMTLGCLVGGLGFAALGLATSPWQFYLSWIFVGAAMAALLYEPAFAAVTVAFGSRYKRGIVLITLVAGFASTVFVPLSYLIADHYGWRNACIGLGIAIALIGTPLHGLGLPRLAPEREKQTRTQSRSIAAVIGTFKTDFSDKTFLLLALWFTAHTAAFSGLIFLIVPTLTSIGADPRSLLVAMALIGPMQVLGRILVATSGGKFSSIQVGRWAMVALALSVLILIVLPPSFASLVCFAILFGAGNGLMTILKGTAIAEYFGTSRYAELNGALAAPSMISKAAAPFLLGTIWQFTATPAHVFLTLLGLLLVGLAAVLKLSQSSPATT